MPSPEPTPSPGVTLRFATVEDVRVILELIGDLAGYERPSHEVVADEARIRGSLFGDRRLAVDEWTVFPLTGSALEDLASRTGG